MLSINEILQKLLDSSFLKYRIGIKWCGIVGSHISKNSSPAYFKDDILYIYTFSSTWLHHLSLIKVQLLNEIKKVDDLKIKDIRFLLAKREKNYKIFEDRKENLLYDISDVILNNEHYTTIDKILINIKDINIKDKFSKMLETAIKRSKFFSQKYFVSRETEKEI